MQAMSTELPGMKKLRELFGAYSVKATPEDVNAWELRDKLRTCEHFTDAERSLLMRALEYWVKDHIG